MTRLSLATILACLLILAGAALAGRPGAGLGFGADAISVPQLMNFQGKLTDAGGNPRNDTLTMTFRIYDAATGGTKYWEEVQSGVVVINGLFNVLLGSVVPIVPDTNLPAGPDCYFEVELVSGGLVPRIRMTSAPYACAAHKAEDVSQKGATPGQILKWSGTEWAPGPDAGGNVSYGKFSADFQPLNGKTVYNLGIDFQPGTGPNANDLFFIQYDTIWPWACVPYNTCTVPADDMIRFRSWNINTPVVDPPLHTWHYVWVHVASLDRIGRTPVIKEAVATEAGRLE